MNKEVHGAFQCTHWGVAAFPADASDLNGLVDRADKALYRAKEGGRNRVEGAKQPL